MTEQYVNASNYRPISTIHEDKEVRIEPTFGEKMDDDANTPVDHHRHEPGTYKEGDALAHGGKSTKHMDDPVKRDLGLRAFPTDDNTTANHLSEPYPQPFQPRDPPPPSTQAASTVAHDSTHNISSMNFVASSPNEAGIGGMGQESKDGDHDTGWIPRGRAYSPLGGLPTGAGQAGRWSSSTNL